MASYIRLPDQLAMCISEASVRLSTEVDNYAEKDENLRIGQPFTKYNRPQVYTHHFS